MPKRKRVGAGSNPRRVVVKKESVEDDVVEQPKTQGVVKRRRPFASAPQHPHHVPVRRRTAPAHDLALNLLPATTSAYFHERFAEEQVCWLREEDPAIVDLWRSYLYTGHIFSNDEVTDQDIPDYGRAESHADGEWTKLAHCYFLGQMLKDEAFANASITALIEKVGDTERFPTGIASEVYGYTQPGDKLRCLVVDLHVWLGKGKCLIAPHEDAEGPAEFLQDVIAEMADAGGAVHEEGRKLWESDLCAYHTHAVTRRCQA